MSAPSVVPTDVLIDVLLDARTGGRATIRGIDGLLRQIARRPVIPLREARRIIAELETLEAQERRPVNPSGRLHRWTYASSSSGRPGTSTAGG